MNQRLIWNFEFTPATTTFPEALLESQPAEELKWEIRFFWPNDEPILLHALDASLLDIAHYQQKHRDDYYYLLPNKEYNIKRRHHELLYKPLVKKANSAYGFASKINIDCEAHQSAHHDPFLQEIAQAVAKEGKEIYVKKEAFIYKFPFHPTVKLELARLEVQDQVYLSACVEGKSLMLVKKVSEYLLGQHASCDYVTFLKGILHL